MSPSEKRDLGRLEGLAFRRVEACGAVVRRFHHLPKRARAHPDYPLLEQVYPWVLAPLSLWPIDVAGLLGFMMDGLEADTRLPEEVRYLAGLLEEVPSEVEQAAVAEQEQAVQLGQYEALIASQHKFDLEEKLLAERADFKADWEALKACFAVDRYRDRKGIIRRRMVQERNFRPRDWRFEWTSPEEQFRVTFDAFCHKWVLYGMEGDRPLLQKLSINVTPQGTMIFIPRYWSFDQKRDLNWKAITRLHRARDVSRQGTKLKNNQQLRQEEALQAACLWEQAAVEGLKEEARYRWVMEKLGWDPRTDPRQLRRLLGQAD